MCPYGDELVDLLAEANKEIVIVSPFIKFSALKRTLDSITNEVDSLKCVTRWRPEDIAAGVCDIEIFDLLEDRVRSKLYVQPVLHTKYFRADDRCLVGSANLTKCALGWALPANLELMVELPSKTPVLRRFEKMLFDTAFEVSEEVRDQIAAAVEVLRSEGTTSSVPTAQDNDGEEDAGFLAERWLPLCTRPELLYRIYSDTDSESIVGWTVEAGKQDIAALRIPPGFTPPIFQKYVAATFLQAPIMRYMHDAGNSAIASEKGRNIIAAFGDDCLQYSAEEHWIHLKCWVLHFLPHLYREPSGSGGLQRGTEIGEYRS